MTWVPSTHGKLLLAIRGTKRLMAPVAQRKFVGSMLRLAIKYPKEAREELESAKIDEGLRIWALSTLERNLV